MARTQKGAVLVTGASTGIGRATALHLDREGYRVFAGVRKQKDANSLKEEASDRLAPVTIDVTKPRSIASARQKIQRAVGKDGLQALVNNAGIATAGPVEHLPVEEFQKVIDVNLTGQYRVTQEFLPLVRKADRGTILFIGSVAGKVANPLFSPYSAAKFGVEGMADSLRREVLPWGIRVVVIEPGSIATPIWGKGNANVDAVTPKMGPTAKRLYGQQIERLKEAVVEAEARGLEPSEVARVVEKAIRARSPKTRYMIGRDAKMMYRAQRLLGDKRFDRVMLKQLGIPREAPQQK